MSETKWGWMLGGVALAAVALATPGGALVAPATLVGGGGLTATLACIACAGAGLFAALSGVGLAVLLWSPGGFAASLACAAACIQAVT